MASPGATPGVLAELAEQVSELLDDAAVAAAMTGPAGELRSAAATDGDVADLVAAELSLEEGPALECFRTGGPVSADDLEGEERWPHYRAHARAAGVRSVVALPLRLGARPAGALVAISRDVRPWSEQDTDAAQLLVDLVSGYLAHEAELQQVRRTVDQLREALVSRIDIEQAKGMLAGELGCTVDHAFVLLRRHARRNNLTLHAVARAVVHLGLRPPAEHAPSVTGTPQQRERPGDR
jgi:GAF domain-containing protein